MKFETRLQTCSKGLAAFALAISAFVFTPSSEAIQSQIQAQAQRAGGGIDAWYRARGFQPVWDGERLGGLAEFIRSLDSHGLHPSLFQLDQWDAQWRNPSSDPNARASVDVGTTQLALYAIQAVAYGFVDPGSVHSKWREIPRKLSAYHFLDQALQQPPARFSSFLLDVAPPQDARYAAMVKKLARYRELDSLGGWRPLPSTGQPVGPGSSYPELRLLTSRLQAEGDLPGGPAPGRNRRNEIDQRTGDAIKSFQFRHGIEPDGFIGAQTLEQLNTPVSQRIKQIIINIDRLRWMPRTWEQPEHIEVNIAESALRIFENRREVTVMPVIVGIKGVSETPVFHGMIDHLFFRPTWNVPTSVARRLLVPAARKHEAGIDAYMRENNYQILNSYGSNQPLANTSANLDRVAAGSLFLRQGPGPNNSLGLIKFMFPNESAVYLHDTPHRDLFERADRDFSAGCVRVARPDELGAYLLRSNSGWDIASVRASMQDTSRENRRENLSKRMPVYLNYWTSTVMGDGRVRFDRDIYGHDATMFQRFGL